LNFAKRRTYGPLHRKIRSAELSIAPRRKASKLSRVGKFNSAPFCSPCGELALIEVNLWPRIQFFCEARRGQADAAFGR
jgi:hypothetical protein